ncbi:pyrroloquinoline quinone biosynthesis protein PqqB [Rubrobacter calidifluminis]|uniref:pyrroloquinoline quinone biosynthesis protein PqqB n=1 Tax=Rubrobacter calidifluminis TaxID=1392640 RepID=UPI002362145D|nr:pyrroloquinoline quinone biosynthesis protein PqqB [Rubrobacter calidifluminis]
MRVLGAAAGGGFPQWNCGCPCCRAVREGSRPCRSRTQSSVAVSADYRRWFLLNASPDVRAQIESFDALHPRGLRESPIEAVLLTDAELDHTAGLLFLREAEGVEVHSTAAVREVLLTGTAVLRTLEAFTSVGWRRVVAGEEAQLGGGLLLYQAFEVPTRKQARFGGGRESVIGYRITDGRAGGSLVYLPGVQELTEGVLDQIERSSCLLFDGTCWRDDELIRLGVSGKSSREMGHLPVGGEDGSLKRLSALDIPRKIYVHINNTNPILLEDSPERRAVEEAGLEVAEDGMELEV